MARQLIVPLLALVALASCNREPAMPIKDFMAQRVDPAAQAYWHSVQFINDETGEHDIFPKTDAEWEKTRQAAEDLGKYGEMLKSDDYAHGRDDWKQFAQGLVDVAKQAELAAEHKSKDEVFDVGGTMYSVCSACHTIYPPPVPSPSAAPSGPAT